MRALLVAWFIAAVAVAGGSDGAGSAGAAASVGGGTLVASPRFVPEAGPLPAGDGRVTWVTRRDDRVLDLWVAQIGAAPRRVQRFSGADGERLRRPRLVASATHVGLRLSVVQARRVTVRSYAGPSGGPLAAVGRLQLDGARDRGVTSGGAQRVRTTTRRIGPAPPAQAFARRNSRAAAR